MSDPHVPKGALLAAAGLISTALLAVIAVRTGLTPPPATAEQQRVERHVSVAASRDLNFFDRKDGAVEVRDARSRAVVAVVKPGMDQGFIRGVMRGLARDRRARGFGAGPPFRLTLYGNRELSLLDLATGRRIELASFGNTNRDAFAALLRGASA